MTLTPEERKLRASIAAHESWAKTPDYAARTQKARDARWQRYIDKARALAPDASEDDVIRRAEHLRAADMKRAAMKSVAARRARAGKK